MAVSPRFSARTKPVALTVARVASERRVVSESDGQIGEVSERLVERGSGTGTDRPVVATADAESFECEIRLGVEHSAAHKHDVEACGALRRRVIRQSDVAQRQQQQQTAACHEDLR